MAAKDKRILTISFDISNIEDVVKFIMGLQLDQLTIGELEMLNNVLSFKRIDVKKELKKRQEHPAIGVHINKRH